MIDVEQLHKCFGSKVAVQEVTFSARDGQITGVRTASTITALGITDLLFPQRELSGLCD